MRPFNDIEWGTIDELMESLKDHADKNMTAPERTEIERRWLVKSGHSLLEQLRRERRMPQQYKWKRNERKSYVEAWLSTHPELRIHRSYNVNGIGLGSFICLKGLPNESGLSREKLEFQTPTANYERILNLICQDPTIKPFQGSIVVPVRLMCITYEQNGTEVTYEIRTADNSNREWIDVELPSE